MNKNYWTKRNVLITGYEGFLGSNLAKVLMDCANVIGLDILVRRKNTLFEKEDYNKITVIKGDVADFKLIKNVLKKYKIDTVFHLAAEAIVGRSLENPLNTFQSNVEGTWNVLEASRELGTVRSVIIASSDKAYGSHKELPYKESAPLKGEHPYDVSKSCADLIAHTYFKTYGLPVVITRCGNIYGPGDFNFSRIVPDAVRCLCLGKTLLIRSDGKFVRDYIYVGDIVDGYILLAENMQKMKIWGEAFNFSNENPMSVTELLERINIISSQKLRYKILNQAEYEIKEQYLCSRKAREIFGWKPSYDLAKGLAITIDWYKDYFLK